MSEFVNGACRSFQRSVCLILALTALLGAGACAPPSPEHGTGEVDNSSRYFKNKIPATAATILEESDGFELLSLNPNHQQKAANGDFPGYRVLGKVVVTDTETRKRLVSAFQRGVAENQGMVAACFNPRHGIRVTRNGRRADFVICFECAQVQLYGDVQAAFLISSSPKALFDSVLRSAETITEGNSE
jgi:hypothetical protein